MADDQKQLTVAELLARNAQERAKKGGDGDSAEAPRRRRRRSLEDGGVSVAELTGSLSKVEATPAQAKHSNVDIDEKAPVIPVPKRDADEAALAKSEEIKKAEFNRKAEEAKKRAAAEKLAAAEAKELEDKRILAEKAEREARAAAATPSSDDTTVIAKVQDAPAQQAKEVQEAKEAKEAKESKDAQAASEDTGVLPVVDAEGSLEEHTDAKAVEELEAEEEPAKLNAVSVVLLALVGIVLGAVVFKGFEILWGSFSRVMVGVLALAVTGIMAGVVHALRTERDKISIVLAIVVGLLLTFGPLLLV